MYQYITFDTVMIIDDSEIERCVLSTLLKKACFGKKIVQFDFAVKALNFLHLNYGAMKFQQNVIFLDINMPGMGGFEFLEYVKDLLGCSNNTVVYMYSGDVSKEDSIRALKYPFVHQILTKPFVQKLINSLATSVKVSTNRKEKNPSYLKTISHDTRHLLLPI